MGCNPKKRGRPSYLPLLRFEGRTQHCWEGSYQAGNVHALTVTPSVLERAFAKLPEPIGQVRVRANGAFAFYPIVVRLTRPPKIRLAGRRYHRNSSGVWAAEF